MFLKNIKLIVVFVLTILSIILMVFFSFPRELSLIVLGILIFFIIFSELKDCVILFVSLIPFFVALPLFDNFDSLNSWRILAIVIFIKWLFEKKFKIKIKKYSIEFWGIILLMISALSLIKAPGTFEAIKKIIFTLNIFILFPVIVDLIKEKKQYVSDLIKSITISSILIIIIGYLQLISTYLFGIFDFVRFWAQKAQLVFYGESWVEIVKQTNTWFTYAGGFVKLRMFSTFTNSHSFPLFLLLALPSIWYLLRKKKLFIRIIAIAPLLAAFIFSGTRGIWLSMIFPIFLIIFLFKKNKEFAKKTIPIFLIFIILIPITSAIIYLPQFRINQLNPDDLIMLLRRIKSGLDLGELSNQGRVLIWKQTFKSILESPVLGVGINNFPIIINEELELEKAGSSAHNIYLQIAAELGLIALLIFLLIIYKLLKACYDLRKNFFAWMCFICFVWAFAYSTTNLALFDGRVFLLLIVTSAMIIGLKRNVSIN